MDYYLSQEIAIDDEGEEIKQILQQKKRLYTQEIRKKKLSHQFNKIRKLVPEEVFSSDRNDQIIEKPLLEQIVEDEIIQKRYEENKYLKNQYLHKSSEIQMLHFLAKLTEELNFLFYNISDQNAQKFEETLDTFFQEFCKEAQLPNIYQQLRSLFLHITFLQIVKSTKTSIQAKNIALWCLINMTYSSNQEFDIIGVLIEQDIIGLFKTLFKDPQYSQLYDNVILIALNICIESDSYKQIFIDEGFLYLISNFIEQIIKNQGNKNNNNNNKNNGISSQMLKNILNFCNCLLCIHDKIEIKQFQIIQGIIDIGIKSNIEDTFTACLYGMNSLFNPQKVLSDWKFNSLYQIRYFSHFFMKCTQSEGDAKEIAQLFRNISFLENRIIHALAKQDLLMPMFWLFENPIKEVRQNIAFCLSNMLCVGNQFISLASNLMLDTKILVLLEGDCLDVQKEAVWALATLLQGQTFSEKEEFFSSKDAINIICKFINDNYSQLDQEIIGKLLDSLIFILEYGEQKIQNDDAYQNNPFWIAIEALQTAKILEEIIEHGDDENSRKAASMFEKYSWYRKEQIDSLLFPGTAL